MRRTASEWVDRLRQVLGGGAPGAEQVADVQAVKQVTAPYFRDDGPNVVSSVECAPRTFQMISLASYIQIVPTGYYDGVMITIVNNATTNTSYPILVAFGRVQRDEGIYAMGMLPGAFLLQNPPFRAAPAAQNENSLEFNLPLTNSPLLVWCDDGIDPANSGTFPITVTLMTRRH